MDFAAWIPRWRSSSFVPRDIRFRAGQTSFLTLETSRPSGFRFQTRYPTIGSCDSLAGVGAFSGTTGSLACRVINGEPNRFANTYDLYTGADVKVFTAFRISCAVSASAAFVFLSSGGILYSYHVMDRFFDFDWLFLRRLGRLEMLRLG